MRKLITGSRISLALFVIFGLIAAFIVNSVVNANRNTVGVVVATTNIPPYSVITANELTTTQVAKSDAEQGSYPSASSLVGKFSNSEIPAGAQVLSPWIDANIPNSEGPAGQSVAVQLTNSQDSGLRAFTVPMTADQGANNIAIGDRIDLIGNVKVPVGSQSTITVTLVIARGVPVISVQQPTAQGGGNTEVTLLVTPQEAMNIYYAESDGTLSTLVSGYGADQNATNISPMTPEGFLSQYGMYLNGSGVSGSSTPPPSTSTPSGGSSSTTGGGSSSPTTGSTTTGGK